MKLSKKLIEKYQRITIFTDSYNFIFIHLKSHLDPTFVVHEVVEKFWAIMEFGFIFIASTSTENQLDFCRLESQNVH